MFLHFTRMHGYASLLAASLAMAVQVVIANSVDTNSQVVVHHLKQLLALVPLLCTDVAFTVLLGPSPFATPSRVVLLGAFLGSSLPHMLRAWTAMERHTAVGSPETRIGMIQALITLAICVGCCLLTYAGGVSAWACLRSLFGLVGICSIALCVTLWFDLEGGALAAYPPLRGSFEGAILAYGGFIVNSVVILAPSRRHRMHRILSAILPEGWLPLSVLKSEDLQQLLDGERKGHQPASQPECHKPGHEIESRRHAGGLLGRITEAQENMAFPSHMEDTQPLDGASGERDNMDPCGASTLGSCSELGDLASLAGCSEPPDANALDESRLIEAPSPVDLSPAFYERQLALERTLAASGIRFVDEDKNEWSE